MAAFNACIGQSRFLVLEEDRVGNKIIETLKDRAYGVVVGQFAVLPSVRAAESLRAEGVEEPTMRTAAPWPVGMAAVERVRDHQRNRPDRRQRADLERKHAEIWQTGSYTDFWDSAQASRARRRIATPSRRSAI